MTSLCNHFRRV